MKGAAGNPFMLLKHVFDRLGDLFKLFLLRLNGQHTGIRLVAVVYLCFNPAIEDDKRQGICVIGFELSKAVLSAILQRAASYCLLAWASEM
jgi:hypothetical protein